MLDDPVNRAMVEVINHIGHVMGKRTIAEFVETPLIEQALQEIGVDYAQGYLIERPRCSPVTVCSANGSPPGLCCSVHLAPFVSWKSQGSRS